MEKLIFPTWGINLCFVFLNEERVVVSGTDPIHVHVGLTFNDRLKAVGSSFCFLETNTSEIWMKRGLSSCWKSAFKLVAVYELFVALRIDLNFFGLEIFFETCGRLWTVRCSSDRLEFFWLGNLWNSWPSTNCSLLFGSTWIFLAWKSSLKLVAVYELFVVQLFRSTWIFLAWKSSLKRVTVYELFSTLRIDLSFFPCHFFGLTFNDRLVKLYVVSVSIF